MSRKNRKTPTGGAAARPSTPPSPPAQPAAPSSTAAKVTAARRPWLLASIALLALVLLGGAIYYATQASRSSGSADPRTQAALASAHSPKFGNLRAKVHIVEFLDPACETCASFFPHVKRILQDNPDQVRLSVRHVPFHKGADQVVRMLEAARNQDKYLEALTALFAAQGRWAVHHQAQPDEAWQVISGAVAGLDLERLKLDMASADIDRRMAQDMDDARTLGVTATPEFFVNGRPLPSFGLDQLFDLVNDELRRSRP